MTENGQFLEIDGIRTYYLDRGEGPTVVLLHGYALGVDAYNTWFRTIAGLTAKFRVITFDQIGRRENRPAGRRGLQDQTRTCRPCARISGARLM